MRSVDFGDHAFAAAAMCLLMFTLSHHSMSPYLDTTHTLALHNRKHTQISTPRAADNTDKYVTSSRVVTSVMPAKHHDTHATKDRHAKNDKHAKKDKHATSVRAGTSANSRKHPRISMRRTADSPPAKYATSSRVVTSTMPAKHPQISKSPTADSADKLATGVRTGALATLRTTMRRRPSLLYTPPQPQGQNTNGDKPLLNTTMQRRPSLSPAQPLGQNVNGDKPLPRVGRIVLIVAIVF